MDEQLEDSESIKESTETVMKKNSSNNVDQEYKIFTTEFDEIAKAEILENVKETQKLRKNLDQQLVAPNVTPSDRIRWDRRWSDLE